MPLDLTPSQHEAVHHGDGPLLILAGPGSGKTRVITQRIAQLLRADVAPESIVALTFTNKAADEMRRRVQKLAPGAPVWIGTFHRFCSRLLRRHARLVGLGEGFTIYDAADSLKALGEAIDAVQCELVHFTPDQIAREISSAKNKLVTAEQYAPRPGNVLGSLVSEIYPVYQARLVASNAVDFDDLLLYVVRMLRESPSLRTDLDRQLQHILVDEYQDTNLAQYVIVRSLSWDFPNLCVTGDPDQSIYGWRGANLSNILDFEKDFSSVHVVWLEQNHRSAGHIVRVADRLISHNLCRKQKRLFTEKASGPPVRLVAYATQQEEAADIAARIAKAVRSHQRHPRDFAIFYRVNALSRTFEHALAEQGIPYQIVNGTQFYQRKEVKDVLAYLQLINNSRDDVAFSRVINAPTRGIGKRTIERLTRYARQHGLTLLAAAREHQRIVGLPKRSGARLARFVEMIDGLQVSVTAGVEQTTRRVLAESGYHDHVTHSGSPDARDRLDNIEELVSAARQYDQQQAEHGSLEGYLEQAALVSDTDNWNSGSDCVTLMTLHAAKGLEFPVVYIVAVEHGLLPHERSRENERQLEEERRLLFVGITRAREQLQLSFARRRAFRGSDRTTIPSQFFMELPRQEMELVNLQQASRPDIELDQSADEPDEGDVRRVRPSPARRRRSGPAPTGKPAGLTTAAELAAGGSDLTSTAAKAADFQVATLVKHPEYGLGKVIAISGAGTRRTATIQFFTPVCRRSFRLQHSLLRPIGPAS